MKKTISFFFAIAIIVGCAVAAFLIIYNYDLIPRIGGEEPSGSTPTIPKDETADWNVYRNEEYGFEFKYSENWKQCDVYSNDVSLQLFRLTGAEQECSVGPNDKPTDVFIMSVEPKIFNTYPTYSELKEALEETKEAVDKLFNISHEKYGQLGLFEVGEIKEIIVNDKPALQVDQISLFGAGYSTGIYIFHKGNLFRILYSLDSLVPSIKKEEIEQLLSTFRFIERDETFNWKVYQNEEYGFKIKYPKEWLEKEYFSGSLVLDFWPPTEEIVISVAVGEALTAGKQVQVLKKDLKKFVDTYIEEMEDSFSSFKIIKSEEIDLKGVPAHRLIYTLILENYSEPSKALEFFILRNSGLIVVSFRAEKVEYYSHYLEAAEKIINSLSFF